MTKRRHRRSGFGSIRKLPSGRYQASYRHEGARYLAEHTFRTEDEARIWLAGVQTDLQRGAWVDPKAGTALLGDYAVAWLANKPELANRTREKYQGLLERHILPTFGHRELAKVSPSAVRGWWSKLRRDHPSTAAQSYRLLSGIYRTAVDDEVILKNPCKVKKGGNEIAEERPIATLAEMRALADAMPAQLRATVLLAGWCGLRLGEILALRRKDVAILGDRGTVNVRQAVEALASGQVNFKVPKTPASRRKVTIPASTIEDIGSHLATHVEPGTDALLFASSNGAPTHPRNLQRAWSAACRTVGVDYHFHDLRHTSNTLDAATGASTKELMVRMGHSTARAALIYQHATEDRDRVIADARADLEAPREPAKVTPIGTTKG